MKISIITVSYNNQKTIADTIKSVLQQSYNNIEYIIIDGQSTDGTQDIIKEYEPLFHGKMKWISEKDNGIYDAMNKGITLSTGTIIGTLNADDFFSSNSIIDIIAKKFIESPNIEAIYGDVHFVHSENLTKCTRYYSSKIFKRSLMRYGFMPAHPSFYIKKDNFKKFGMYNTSYKIAADFEFLLRCIFIGNIPIFYIPIDMVTMRAGGASTSGLKSHVLIMKEHLKAFKENKIHSNVFLLSLRYIYKIIELARKNI